MKAMLTPTIRCPPDALARLMPPPIRDRFILAQRRCAPAFRFQDMPYMLLSLSLLSLIFYISRHFVYTYIYIFSSVLARRRVIASFFDISFDEPFLRQ